MNPLDKLTIKEVRAALADCETGDGVRAVVTTGRGWSFSAGGDLKLGVTYA